MTQFSEDQIAEFQEAFSLFDKDADGYVTAEDVGVAIRALGVALSETELQMLVQDASKSNHGKVDFPDFLTLMAHILGNRKDSPQDEENVMLEALTLLDKDQSGVISADVLRHVLMSLGETMTSEEVEELIKEADKEETGQINYREFVKMMMS